MEFHQDDNEGVFTHSSYDDVLDSSSLPVYSVGAEADTNNMDSTYVVSPIPTHRIHKDLPKAQILGDPRSAVQTRGKLHKGQGEHLVSYVQKQRRTNHKDF